MSGCGNTQTQERKPVPADVFPQEPASDKPDKRSFQAEYHGFRVEQPITALLAGFPNGRHLKWPLVKLSGLAKVTGLCLGIAVKKEKLLDTHDHVGSERTSC